MEDEGIQNACGTDISSGHAADTVFTEEMKDPWADDCLVTFADLVINYDDVVYPLPSDAAITQLEPDKLPALFVRGRDNRLIAPLVSKTASSVYLSPKVIREEWSRFASWAANEAQKLYDWRHLHVTKKEITGSHDDHVPAHIVEAVWSEIDRAPLRRVTNLDDSGLEYAFDVFVRTIQYDDVLGSRRYFAHPLREYALGDYLVLQQFQEKWSWGRYLLASMVRGAAPLDPSWFVDRLAEIRERVIPTDAFGGARWIDLAHKPENEQRETLEAIAADLDLPAELKKWAQRALAATFGVGSLLAARCYAISVILGAGAIAIEKASPNVPGRRGAIPIVRGTLKWRGLFDDDAA